MSPWIRRLHDAVDALAAPVAAANAGRLNCRAGCHACCSDGLTVFEIEAANIEQHHAALLADGTPHPEGACAFLDGAGHCRIYEHRPYVCRTQGLPLRWIDEDDNGEPYEARDICTLNDANGLEELPAEHCWSIGPFEQRLAAAQPDGRRVALRSLFDRKRRLPVAP